MGQRFWRDDSVLGCYWRALLAFYEDGTKHYGGALVLFKRNLSVAVPNAKTHRQANCCMPLKIGGRKSYVARSTKPEIYEDAYEYAKTASLR